MDSFEKQSRPASVFSAISTRTYEKYLTGNYVSLTIGKYNSRKKGTNFLGETNSTIVSLTKTHVRVSECFLRSSTSLLHRENTTFSLLLRNLHLRNFALLFLETKKRINLVGCNFFSFFFFWNVLQRSSTARKVRKFFDCFCINYRRCENSLIIVRIIQSYK